MPVEYHYTDSALIQNLKQPEKMNAAIKVLFSMYYSPLENYIIKNKGTKDDAADVIQETVIAFVEIISQNKFRGDASIKSFLHSIARNIWLTELRRRNNTDNRNKIFETGKDAAENEIIQHLIKREYFVAIEHIFERLGEKCRQLLMLVYYEELSMNDIIKRIPGYENEQVLRNKKYKCMKQMQQMISKNENLKIQLKNALKYAG